MSSRLFYSLPLKIFLLNKNLFSFYSIIVFFFTFSSAPNAKAESIGLTKKLNVLKRQKTYFVLQKYNIHTKLFNPKAFYVHKTLIFKGKTVLARKSTDYAYCVQFVICNIVAT